MRTFSLRVSMFFLIVVFVFGSLSFTPFVHAEDAPPVAPPQDATSEGVVPEDAVLVADVDVQDIHLISQENNVFTIAFSVHNGQGVQPAIIYAADLLKKDDKGNVVVVDKKVYHAEMFGLGTDERVTKAVTYIAPEYLKGEYFLGIEAANPDALPLGMVSMQEPITLNGNEEYVKVNADACYLTVSGEGANKHYTPLEGVDITKEETLTAHCSVKNAISADITVTPLFTTRHRSAYGKLIGEEKQAPITLKTNQETLLSFKLPKVSESQSYDAVLTLQAQTGFNAAPPVTFHYVVRGGSATIQNLTLDKDKYKKGDEAKVTFYWTGSADGFPGSRLGTSEIKDIKAKFTITDSKKNTCAQSVQNLSTTYGGAEHFTLSVDSDCVDPIVTASIVDGNDATLANNTYEIVSKKEKTLLSSGISFAKENALATIGAAFILALILFLLVYLLRHNKKLGIKVLAGIIVGGGVLLGGGESASAATFTITIPDPGNAGHSMLFHYTRSIDKSVYTAGSTLQATVLWENAVCSNGVNATWAPSTVMDASITVNGVNAFNFLSPTFPSVRTFTVQAIPGNYTADFIINADMKWPGGWKSKQNKPKLPYAVIPVVVPPTLNFSVNPSATVTAGTPQTLSWSSNTGDWCVKGGSWSGQLYTNQAGKGVTGSSTATLPVGTYTYSLACQDSLSDLWSPTQSLTLTVNPAATCTGAVPANATLWSAATPATNTAYFQSATNGGACSFGCNVGTSWNGSACAASSSGPVPACTGVTPAGAVIHPGDSTPALSIGKTYSLFNTAPACQFYCASGTWNGSACAVVTSGPGPGPGPGPGAPSITVFTVMSPIVVGDWIKIDWTSSGATNCSGTGTGFTGTAKPSNGSDIIMSTTVGTFPYTLECFNASGVSSGVQIRQLTVTSATPLPSISFTATPTSVASGNSSTLAWSTSNATSCTASGGWSGSKATSGSGNTGAITASTNFSLTCSGPGGSTTKTATVAILSPCTCSAATAATVCNTATFTSNTPAGCVPSTCSGTKSCASPNKWKEIVPQI